MGYQGMASAPRIRNGKNGASKSVAEKRRSGRPSLDAIDHVLMEAIRRAAKASGIKVSRLVSVNVQIGLILGASREATLKRLQTKAKHKRI